MKNVLVHGFNVKNPHKTVGKLIGYLDNTYLFDYGWFGIFSVLFKNKKEATKLKDKLYSFGRNTVIGHSNGCAIAVESARQGADIDLLVCINPALKVDTEFPQSIKKVLVIHTRHDRPTKAARFFDKVPFVSILAPNAWGAMGAYGYKGSDRRVMNWNMSEQLSGHSDFFDKLPELMPRVDAKINRMIDTL